MNLGSYCPSCSQPIRAGSLYCPACGKQFQPTKQTNKASHPSVLMIDQTEIGFGALSLGVTDKRVLHLTNNGSDRLKIYLNTDVPWVQVIPGPYILGPDQTQKIQLQANTTRLTRTGNYTGMLLVSSEAGQANIRLSLTLVPPFILNPGDAQSTVSSLQSIVHYCDHNWKTAVRLLDEGRLEACLDFLGESQATATLQDARDTYADLNLSLEAFLRSFDSHRSRRAPRTNHHILEARLGFGPRGLRVKSPPAKLALKLGNPNRNGYLWGQVRPLVQWMKIHPSKFGCAPGATTHVTILVHRSRWPRYKRGWSPKIDLYEIVLLELDGRVERCIRKTTAPGLWLMIAIWITVGLLLVIIGVVVGVAVM